jgi:hypothetical protein
LEQSRASYLVEFNDVLVVVVESAQSLQFSLVIFYTVPTSTTNFKPLRVVVVVNEIFQSWATIQQLFFRATTPTTTSTLVRTPANGIDAAAAAAAATTEFLSLHQQRLSLIPGSADG